MSDSYTTRLEAVRTAIDAVIANAAAGEYVRSYSIGDRTWTGESFKDLLTAMRAEEEDLVQKIADATATGGSVSFVSFRNEPQ